MCRQVSGGIETEAGGDETQAALAYFRGGVFLFVLVVLWVFLFVCLFFQDGKCQGMVTAAGNDPMLGGDRTHLPRTGCHKFTHA